ncbi:hypothetical protein BCR33DRAFT_169851 [Rhizoclosmatium globosum]|uniref:Uncharacterized protein n=1 Tax=Rhizoclosmatium globosum TaxID=329046 RepID=A0A1Y2CGU0_9FUNG|nr:hypothetical protein BCR33DRAFT_169851 [Rhizoclosmatium globosum]|eukprot:ORY45535.1 hypothetical protein BCR33DRAFT_169851 [Rhizoclosmatium globosum]
MIRAWVAGFTNGAPSFGETNCIDESLRLRVSFAVAPPPSVDEEAVGTSTSEVELEADRTFGVPVRVPQLFPQVASSFPFVVHGTVSGAPDSVPSPGLLGLWCRI